CCALTVETGKAEIDVKNISHVSDVLTVYTGIVIGQDSDIIRLVHYTTQK
ncbi:hypothetical protein COCVIDRAFT_113529, partial [Bipolaris victoriae FI3]